VIAVRHPMRYRLEWCAAVLLRAFACLWPPRVASAFGCALGRAILWLWRSRRRIAAENLHRAFPDWEERQIAHTVGEVGCNFGRTAFEILRINPSTPSSVRPTVEVGNLDSIKQAQAEGKGALFMSGHIGNWELFAGWVHAQGYDFDVVVKPMRNPYVDRLYNSRRAALGVGIIHTQVATREIVKALRRNHFVAILADQYAGDEGVDVTFFGRRASTPRGPAMLALKYQIPIIAGVFLRQKDGSFRVEIDGRIEIDPTGDTEADIAALTQRYTTLLEEHIRRYPGQWLWTHRRWRD